MAYDKGLAERIRGIIAGEPGVVEKKMFGGIGWMLDGNMAAGVMADGRVMIRVAAEGSEELAARPHAGLMEQRGKAMRGWVLVAPEGVATDEALRGWVARGVAYARSLPPK